MHERKRRPNASVELQGLRTAAELVGRQAMIDDPIVEEVHRVRARLLAECDGDLDKLMDRIRQRESQDECYLVNSPEELKARRLRLAS